MTEPIHNDNVFDYGMDLPNENQSDIYSESDESQENDLMMKDFADNVLKRN
jgi:hypothetical protein